MHANGVNFAFFSQHATRSNCCCFDEHDDPEPIQHIMLYPSVPRLSLLARRREGAQTRDALRAASRRSLRPESGASLQSKQGADRPYAKGNTNNLWIAEHLRPRGQSCEIAAQRGDRTADYDWEGDIPLRRPMSETIVYEMHVGGFTRHPGSRRGTSRTFRGVTEKIPYLQSLGVTAVELLPVFEYDETEGFGLARTALRSPTIGVTAPSASSRPHRAYCTSPEEGTPNDRVS